MIRLYVSDIENSLKNKCYFSALAMSLALPDICGTAEYPHETSTAKRYIEWYNKYLGEYMSDDRGNPYLSGEVVYNLRNTLLHTGSPNIDSNKVKNEANKLDIFALKLGDSIILNLAGVIGSPYAKVRIMRVNVTYLCQTICDCSLWYYKNNADKFHFNFFIEPPDDLLPRECELPLGDPIIKILNNKLEQSGVSGRFLEDQDHTTINTIFEGLEYILADEELKPKYLNGAKISLVREKTSADTPVLTSNTEPTIIKESASERKTKPDKREAQIRSFFDQHFKEKKYKQKKEIIIQTVLKSKTKQQVNNALMKSFASEETGAIYKRLSPLLALLSLPGK